MSPLGGAILSVLLITGIMTAGKSYEGIGIPAAVWYGINAVLLILLVVQEIRTYLKKRKSGSAE